MVSPACIRTFYGVLELSPQASPRQIRDAHRALSKRYHPDTTSYDPETAQICLREVQEAYRILGNPASRAAYDLYLRAPYALPPVSLSSRSDDGLPTERPLSGGELFALFILGATLLGCLSLAFLVALLREPL